MGNFSLIHLEIFKNKTKNKTEKLKFSIWICAKITVCKNWLWYAERFSGQVEPISSASLPSLCTTPWLLFPYGYINKKCIDTAQCILDTPTPVLQILCLNPPTNYNQTPPTLVPKQNIGFSFQCLEGQFSTSSMGPFMVLSTICLVMYLQISNSRWSMSPASPRILTWKVPTDSFCLTSWWNYHLNVSGLCHWTPTPSQSLPHTNEKVTFLIYIFCRAFFISISRWMYASVYWGIFSFLAFCCMFFYGLVFVWVHFISFISFLLFKRGIVGNRVENFSFLQGCSWQGQEFISFSYSVFLIIIVFIFFFLLIIIIFF